MNLERSKQTRSGDTRCGGEKPTNHWILWQHLINNPPQKPKKKTSSQPALDSKATESKQRKTIFLHFTVVMIESPPEITGESFIAQSKPLSSDSMTPVLTN